MDPLLWHLFRRYVHYKLMCIEVTKNVQRCVYPVVFPFQEKNISSIPHILRLRVFSQILQVLSQVLARSSRASGDTHGTQVKTDRPCMFQAGGERLARYSIDIKWCH